MENHTQLLQKLLVAQVLTLAKTMEAEKHTVGHGGGKADHISEAVALVADQQANVLQLLFEAA